MRTLLSLSILAALVVPGTGCAGLAQRVCELECECEHCNDVAYELRCQASAAAQDYAAAYGCEAEWEAHATCVEERGTCDESAARFSTREQGSCSGEQPLGGGCAVDADCPPGGFCGGGACMTRVCSGSSMPCAFDSDCQGEDLCESAEEELVTCLDDASENGRDSPFSD